MSTPTNGATGPHERHANDQNPLTDPPARYPTDDVLRDALFEGPEANLRRYYRFVGARPGEHVELQVLDVPQPKSSYRPNYFTHAANEEAFVELCAQGERMGAPGVYAMLNQIDPAVVTRAQAGVWHQQRRGGSTTDADIQVRRVLFVDVDPERPSGTSSTDAQMDEAHAIGKAVADRLALILGRSDAILRGGSGNGASVLVALDYLPQTPELTSTIRDILTALGAIHGSDRVKIDRSVSDPKRLAPAFGTMKRKGAPDVPERPHRRSACACSLPARRISLSELAGLRDALVALAQEAAPAESSTAGGERKKKDGKHGKREPQTDSNSDSPWSRANALDPRDVCTWLGILEGDLVRCPGCGETSGVDAIDHGIKCFHDRCADKGRNGFRTNIDLVMEVREITVKEAYSLLAEQFRLEPLGSSLPQIRLSHLLEENATDAIRALGTDPEMYQREGKLVRVVRISRAEAEATQTVVDGEVLQMRVEGTPVIRPHNEFTLMGRMSTVAEFLKWVETKSDYKHTLPSEALVKNVMGRCEYPGTRVIVGVADTPILRPDGTIAEEPGFDQQTGYLLCHAPGRYKSVKPHPDKEDARASLAELEEVFCDFQYTDPSHRYVAISAILTYFARAAIRGSVPAHLFDANIRGAGKTLQTDGISLICTGRPVPRRSYPRSEEELEKVLGCFAMEATSLICIDNVNRPFGGESLDAVLTATDTVQFRVLGETRQPTLPWRAILLGTGNNFGFIGDTSDRVLMARIESPHENPRALPPETWTHPNLLAWVLENHDRLVVAALTVLRAFFAAKSPDMGCAPWGSFEAWARLIPHALRFAGATADVMGARITDETQVNDELSHVAFIVQEWRTLESLTAYPGGMMLRDVVDALYNSFRPTSSNRSLDPLRGAVEALSAPGQRSGETRPTAQRLGTVLRKYVGRNFGGLRLVKRTGDSHQKILYWTVEQVAFAGSAGSAGTVSSVRGKIPQHISDSPRVRVGGSAGENFSPIAGAVPAVPAVPATRTEADRLMREVNDLAELALRADITAKLEEIADPALTQQVWSWLQEHPSETLPAQERVTARLEEVRTTRTNSTGGAVSLSQESGAHAIDSLLLRIVNEEPDGISLNALGVAMSVAGHHGPSSVYPSIDRLVHEGRIFVDDEKTVRRMP